MKVLYRINPQAVTYREYWRLPGFSLFLQKLFHLPIAWRHLPIEREEVTRLDPVDPPAPLRRACEAVLQASTDHGLKLGFYFALPVLGWAPGIYGAALLGREQRVAAVLAYFPKRWPPTSISCYSTLAGGRVLKTTDTQEWIADPPAWEKVIVPQIRYYAEDVLEHHCQRLASSEPVAVAPEALHAYLTDLFEQFFDYQVERGVLVPVPPDEADDERIRADLSPAD
jgi:hypothetical protein